ncbi:hypothetical protein [Marinobacter xestospongiae]|uniref:Uncharacterized protein n=1 Tax=Marinobacter xestospongiae TaxID=994319 RepID=A0ABU3W1Q3_9GAMM|nr:hypothetical protein [Marinobacter xestospongiae]MDV2080117.1 hypothetical protein [Marinobacter xestospongiae]
MGKVSVQEPDLFLVIHTKIPHFLMAAVAGAANGSDCWLMDRQK